LKNNLYILLVFFNNSLGQKNDGSGHGGSRPFSYKKGISCLRVVHCSVTIVLPTEERRRDMDIRENPRQPQRRSAPGTSCCVLCGRENGVVRFKGHMICRSCLAQAKALS
jgi:ribosomal protein S14